MRDYGLNDMTQCGSMGFVELPNCRIDAAVAPLFYLYCATFNTAKLCTTYPGGLYPQGKSSTALWTVANDINALFVTMRQPTDTWTRYLAAVDTASRYWTQIQSQAWQSVIPGAKILHSYDGSSPKGLYYLMSYAAYEFPFAWWFRCGWILGLDVGPNAQACPAWDGIMWDPSNATSDWDVYPTQLPGKNVFDIPRRSPIPRQQWLASLNGVFNTAMIQEARNNAHQAFQQVIQGIETRLPAFQFSCFTEGWLRTDIPSQSYSDTAYQYSTSGKPWPSTQLDGCSGPTDCLDHRVDTVQANKDIAREYIALLSVTGACNPSCTCITDEIPSVCAFAQDIFPDQIPLDQNYMPLFQMKGASNINLDGNKYDPLVTGCSLNHCCRGNASCSAANELSSCVCYTEAVTEEELRFASLSNVKPTTPAWIMFLNQSDAPSSIIASQNNNNLVNGDAWSALDPCAVSGQPVRCSLVDEPIHDDCTKLSNPTAQAIRNTCVL